MAIPKNFNQIEKRVESLNDLTFYKISYEYEFTEKFQNQIEEDYGDYTTNGKSDIDKLNEAINGVKEFVALDNETAKRKIEEWLDSLVKQEILSDYDITEIEELSFHDKLKQQKLNEILEFNKGTE
ncbi:MAG: hypothetical protein ACXACC_10650 [Promethearchaeota archaeon]|jgi:hypothetical protein